MSRSCTFFFHLFLNHTNRNITTSEPTALALQLTTRRFNVSELVLKEKKLFASIESVLSAAQFILETMRYFLRPVSMLSIFEAES